jgi:hypothetical protein
MNTDFRVSIDLLTEPVPGCAAEMDRLGDEIAELSAHLDAATARSARCPGWPRRSPAARCRTRRCAH